MSKHQFAQLASEVRYNSLAASVFLLCHPVKGPSAK